MKKMKCTEKRILNPNDTHCEFCGQAKKLVENKMCLIWMPTCNCEEEHENKLNYPFRKQINRLKKANLGYLFRNTRLKRLNCQYVDICKQYVDNFEPRTQSGLFLAGNVGTGKTSLAVGIAKELIFKGYSVKFMVFSQVIRLLQSTYSAKNPLDFMEQMEILSKYDLLIFDDFARETYKERTLTDVYDFIDYIYKNCNNVVITANLEQVIKVKQIPDMEAIIDRMKQMSQVLLFKGESMRCKHGN